MASRIPPYTLDRTRGSQALVDQEAMEEMRGLLLVTQRALHDQSITYQQIATDWLLEIGGLRKDGRALAKKVHELEDELTGSKAAQQAMQAALQMRESENSRLLSGIKEVGAQHHQILAQLEISERENAQNKKSLEQQEALIAANARRVTTNDHLQKKMQERAGLEVELRKTNEAMQQERNRIGNPVTLGAGVLVGLLTGGLGGFLIGLVGGQVASSVVTESANCPCMTTYHAQLISAQKRLDLVNQEIDRLKNLLA